MLDHRAPNLIDRLRQHAEQTPEHCAVEHPSIRLSYAQLWRAVAAQSLAFSNTGICTDATLGICCDDDVQHLVATLAGMALGANSCTLPSHQSAVQRAALSKQCGVTHEVGTEQLLGLNPMADGGSDITASVPEAAEANVLFATSGTTGRPKIVILSAKDLVAQAPRHVQAASERFACRASMEHNFAKRHRLYCVAQGASNVFLDGDAQSLAEQCLEQRVSVLHLSAFQAQELLAAPAHEQLSHLRLKLGGAHVAHGLRARLREAVTRNVEFGYGTTETGAIAFTDPADADSGESVGRALPGIEVCIRDDGGALLAPDQTGEITIRCAGMFRGYLGDELQTSAALDDGWFCTGDVGRLDSGGRIHLSGRSDDMFVFNTMNIHPQDIESELLAYPGIRDAIVVPKPSPVHGAIPVALIVCDPATNVDARALQRHMRERVGLRCPRQFIQADSIPRNSSGKMLRGDAQALLGSLSGAA